MGNYVGNDTQNTFTLATKGITDVAWSNDEKIIYAATADGKIKVFDVATHALLKTWSVGKSLGALSLSDDGKTLVAGGVTSTDASVVFAINTVKGTKTVFKPAVAGVGDVEIVDNQQVLVSGNGGGQILTLDLAKGTFTPLAGGVFYGPYSCFTEDKHITLFGEPGTSNGPLFLYDDRTGTIVASGDNYQPGVRSGFNFGIQAVSEAAGLALQFGLYYGANVYDLKLKAIKYVELSDSYPQGFSFSPDGKSLYAYFVSGEVKQFSTADWSLISRYTAPAAEWGPDFYGNVVHASSNGAFISVLANSGSFSPSNASLTLIDLTSRNEVFKGTTGADTFAGGLGNDTYVVNNAGDVVKENKFAGTDKVLASISYTLTANVEDLQLTGSAALDGSGNTADNTLIGNAGVNTLDGGNGDDRLVGVGGGDTLKGGNGDDTLVSGKGIDTLIGGLGNDTYEINDLADAIVEAAKAGTDTVQVAASYVLADNLENLVLAGKAANGIGNALDNAITGNIAANTLSGGEGDDRLYGMAGKDTLLGGAGNDLLDGGADADRMTGGTGGDTYVVDHVRDAIVEAAGGGTDTVIAAIDWKLSAELENLTLAPGTAPLNAAGNALANVLTGNDGDNRLSGGLGADRMSGGLGDDTYVVDDKGDKTIEAFTGGTDTVLSSVSWTLALGTENLTLTGRKAINGTGTFLANVITGNAGDNVIDGGGSDDAFQRDTLIGGDGNDTYIVDQFHFYRFDIIEKAGEGTDRVVSNTSYDALPDNVENLVLTGTSNLSGGGNALYNGIIGNAADNALQGYDGNDTLIGGAGNDTLDGGTGVDTMRGGLGNDKYYVDSNADKVTEKAGEGDNDIVRTFITLTIPDEIEAMSLQGAADIDAMGSARGERLLGNTGVNALNGAGDDDLLYDNGFNDTLTGGGGKDLFVIGSFGMVGAAGSTVRITDFSSADEDQISLVFFDGNPATPEPDPLTFIGTAGFSGTAGELRFARGTSDTTVSADLDGDKLADFTITLTGELNLTESDFQLSL